MWRERLEEWYYVGFYKRGFDLRVVGCLAWGGTHPLNTDGAGEVRNWMDDKMYNMGIASMAF